MSFKDFTIVGSSPEILIKLDDKKKYDDKIVISVGKDKKDINILNIQDIKMDKIYQQKFLLIFIMTVIHTPIIIIIMKYHLILEME